MGFVPIYMKITLNKKKTTINLQSLVKSNKWNSHGFVEGRGDEVRKLNAQLELMKARIQGIYRDKLSAGEEITLNTIKEEFTGRVPEKKVHTLISVFEDHNDEMNSLTRIKYSPWTVKHYRTTLKYLKEYLQANYNVNDIQLKALDYSFVSNFEKYILTTKKCYNNGAMKHVQRLKKITNRAIKLGWLDTNPFHAFKVSYKRFERGYLTILEVKSIEQAELPFRLSKIRDVFVFQIYTGLAYCDVKALKPSNISTGIDGNQWIFIARQKTKIKSTIPLLPKANLILNKYHGDEHCLPVISNQKMNKGLKEIADICKIEKRLSTHLARHTFGTTITLSNGVPIETVSKMLGHTKLSTTQIYSQIVEQKIADDMSSLVAKLQ